MLSAETKNNKYRSFHKRNRYRFPYANVNLFKTFWRGEHVLPWLGHFRKKYLGVGIISLDWIGECSFGHTIWSCKMAPHNLSGKPILSKRQYRLVRGPSKIFQSKNQQPITTSSSATQSPKSPSLQLSSYNFQFLIKPTKFLNLDLCFCAHISIGNPIPTAYIN